MKGAVETAAVATRVGRNDLCPCGSGKKYKQCCASRDVTTPLLAVTARAAAPPTGNRRKILALAKIASEHGGPTDGGSGVRLSRNRTSCAKGAERARRLRRRSRAMWPPRRRRCRLRRAIRLRPSFDAALRQLAPVLEQLRRNDEAADAYRKLANLADEPSECRYWAARALIVEGKQGAAEMELRRVLAAAPQHAPARIELGQTLTALGKFEEAERLLMPRSTSIPVPSTSSRPPDA